MNTKKAINILEFYKINPPKHCERNEELQEVIELLQRGEKFEFIFSDMHSTIQHLLDGIYLYNIKLNSKSDAEYIAKAFEIIEEKYFPKKNDNDKELIKRIRKIIKVINESGITLEEFNKVFIPKC